MSDDRYSGVEFNGDNAEERRLWEQLKDLPASEPSPLLRQKFYRQLDKASQPSLLDKLRQHLGLNGMPGFITATACLVIGLALGNIVERDRPIEAGDFAELQTQVTRLHRNLILDRLESASANKRLQGVIEAAEYVDRDPELARALLTRATQDKVTTVRSAAIGALGPQLNSPAVGDELMALLDNSPAPLVQFALIDLILRHGDRLQIERLLQLSDSGTLNQELADYVQSAVGRNDA